MLGKVSHWGAGFVIPKPHGVPCVLSLLPAHGSRCESSYSALSIQFLPPVASTLPSRTLALWTYKPNKLFILCAMAFNHSNRKITNTDS